MSLSYQKVVVSMSLSNDFEQEAVIGEGTFAIVARYKNLRSGESVAVKLLKREYQKDEVAKARFRNETLMLRQLSGHIGIMPITAEYLSPPDFAFVMPLASQNMLDFVRRGNNELDLKSRLEIFDPIIVGLRAAHDQGILHRDIAPHNVLMFGTRSALSDFGLGKSADELMNLTRSSAAGYGRAHYVAPEQLESLKAATVQSDVYSMGKLLNFVMTGKSPDRHYPCEFSRVIVKATEVDPDDRFQSMAEFSALYEALKKLYLQPVAPENATVEFLANSDEPPDWDAWHRAAVSGEHSEHVYYGYLKPVMDYLSEDPLLSEYCAAVGPEIHAFVKRFIGNLNDCLGSVGWPFSATTSFARFLRKLINTIDREDSQSLCAATLWDLAYVSDQWGAQDVAKQMFGRGEVSDAVGYDLAGHILETGAVIEIEKLSDVRLPDSVRSAIAQMARDNTEQ